MFCRMLASSDDEANLILHRARSNFVVLNKYPYISGHLMIVPNRHISELDDAGSEELQEMMMLSQLAIKGLRKNYHPEGFNMGINLGEAAGAGIKDHIHLHVLPRWLGDTNFMTSVGDTRVIIEDLNETFRKLRHCFNRLDDVP